MLAFLSAISKCISRTSMHFHTSAIYRARNLPHLTKKSSPPISSKPDENELSYEKPRLPEKEMTIKDILTENQQNNKRNADRLEKYRDDEEEDDGMGIMHDREVEATLNSGFSINSRLKSNFYPEEEETFDALIDDLDGKEVLISCDWNDIGIRDNIIENAAKNLNVVKPTIVQTEALAYILQRRDVIICCQTGSGKSLGILMGILCLSRKLKKRPHPFITKLVIVPTPALAHQYYEWAAKLLDMDLKDPELAKYVQMMWGRSDLDDNALLINAGLHKVPTPDLLIATPGRVIEELKKGRIDLTRVEIMAFDEADQLLQARDHKSARTKFKYDKRRVIHPPPALLLWQEMDRHSLTKDIKQVIVASSTIDRPTVNELFRMRALKSPVMVNVGEKFRTPLSISHFVYQAWENYEPETVDDKSPEIVASIMDQFKVNYCLFLIIEGQPASKFKERFNMTGMRTMYLDDYFVSKEAKNLNSRTKKTIVLATENSIRGVDIPDLDLVIIYGRPKSVISYLHMAGRIGRMDKPGKSVVVYKTISDASFSSVARTADIDFSPIFLSDKESMFKESLDMEFTIDQETIKDFHLYKDQTNEPKLPDSLLDVWHKKNDPRTEKIQAEKSIRNMDISLEEDLTSDITKKDFKEAYEKVKERRRRGKQGQSDKTAFKKLNSMLSSGEADSSLPIEISEEHEFYEKAEKERKQEARKHRETDTKKTAAESTKKKPKKQYKFNDQEINAYEPSKASYKKQ